VPELRVRSSEQLSGRERLGEVVVRAHLEADDAIGLLAARGQHDDRRVRLGAQLAAKRQAVLARQHQVEHDQIDLAARERCPHRLAVGSDTRLETVLAQICPEQGADLGVVIDD